MEGLEISLVPKSNLEFSGRIDSEYYQKKFLKLEAEVQARTCVPMGEAADFLIGPFGSAFTVDNYTDVEDFRYIRGKDVKPLTLMDNDNVFMPEADYRRLERYALREDDVMISVVGTIGNAALVTDKDLPAVFSCKSSVVRPQTLNPVFLTVYLNCRHGRNLTLRKERGAIQKGLNLDDLKDVLVFKPSADLQRRVEQAFRNALVLTEQSKYLQAQAEGNFLDALGLTAWTPPEPLSFVARASDVLSAERFDPEHFKGQYQAAQDQLAKKGAVRFEPLGEMLSYLTNGHTPLRHDLSVGNVPFLAAEHVNDFSINYDSEKRILTEHHEGELLRTALKRCDVLMTIKGRIGNAALVDVEKPMANINQDVALLRFNEDAPPVWFTLAFLNSQFGKLEIRKWATGQINPFLGLYNLKKVRVPRFSAAIESEIAEKTRTQVGEALHTRFDARQLLEATKRAVEIAIEQGEDAAMAFLDDAQGAS